MITTLSQFLIVVSGLWLIAAGILMFAKPLTAKAIIAKAGSTNLVNYAELGLRGIWAAAILQFAPLSKYPQFFKLFGIMLATTTLILLLVPRKLHARFAVWSSTKMSVAMLRVSAPIAIVFGVFLVYSVFN